MTTNSMSTATIGGGCFWCIEAILSELKGVEKIVSGYTGGNAPGKPTYKEVCSGLTGHAEVVQVTFDPSVISYENLLMVFMTSHDPTTLNRQGGDVGTQYRSVIYYHDTNQKSEAQKVLKNVASYYEAPIVTELSPSMQFHEAEAYHQDYYKNNTEQGYCSAIITPKLAKLRKQYANLLK